MAVRTWQGWEQKEFKPSHCIDLISIMSKGQTAVQFMADNNMSQATFYRWLAAYPDLKIAYDIGKTHGKAYLLKMLDSYSVETSATQDSPTEKLNLAIWKERMKYGFDVPEKKEAMAQLANAAKQSVEAPRTMMTSVLEALKGGLIEVEQAQKIATLIETAQRVCDVAELTERLEAVEDALQSGIKLDDFRVEEHDQTQT